jgi:hypothetical protein
MTSDFRLWTLACGGIGGLAGLAIFILLLGNATSIEVIQTGRVGGIENIQSKISPQLVIDRKSAPVALIERMQTIGFAKRVADKTGVNPLDLAASQYGGKGRLRVRQIGDGSLIEIRVKAADPDIALKLAVAAGELGIADDRSMMAPLRAKIEARIAELSHQRDTSLAVANALSIAAFRSETGDTPALSSASEALAKAQVVSDALWAIESGAVEPVSQDAAVFAEASLAKPILSHWWQAALLGALAGAVAGFSTLLSIQRTKPATHIREKTRAA